MARRPPIEREYLAALAAAVPLETWQAICERAAADALTGDAKARDWLARQLLGREPPALLDVAAADAAKISPESAIQQRAKSLKQAAVLENVMSCFGDGDE